jgi:hypothetical protein
VIDPYICAQCRTVFAYLDLMGDPVCGCGGTQFFPVKLASDPFREALELLAKERSEGENSLLTVNDLWRVMDLIEGVERLWDGGGAVPAYAVTNGVLQAISTATEKPLYEIVAELMARRKRRDEARAS